MKIIHLLCLLFIAVIAKAASPVEALLERIDKGASGKFIIEQIKSPVDFFELDQKGNKVVIRGNNPVNIMPESIFPGMACKPSFRKFYQLSSERNVMKQI